VLPAEQERADDICSLAETPMGTRPGAVSESRGSEPGGQGDPRLLGRNENGPAG
jgi:hypothetical protein